MELAARRAAQEGGAVLIPLDCDDACPAELGPALLARARMARPDVPIVVALAHREYESWFLAAAASLANLQGLPADLEAPQDPVRIRDAKGWLGTRMGVPYDPVTHQLRFTRAFDLDAARSSPSFDRLVRRPEALRSR